MLSNLVLSYPTLSCPILFCLRLWKTKLRPPKPSVAALIKLNCYHLIWKIFNIIFNATFGWKKVKFNCHPSQSCCTVHNWDFPLYLLMTELSLYSIINLIATVLFFSQVPDGYCKGTTIYVSENKAKRLPLYHVFNSPFPHSRHILE